MLCASPAEGGTDLNTTIRRRTNRTKRNRNGRGRTGTGDAAICPFIYFFYVRVRLPQDTFAKQNNNYKQQQLRPKLQKTTTRNCQYDLSANKKHGMRHINMEVFNGSWPKRHGNKVRTMPPRYTALAIHRNFASPSFKWIWLTQHGSFGQYPATRGQGPGIQSKSSCIYVLIDCLQSDVESMSVHVQQI